MHSPPALPVFFPVLPGENDGSVIGSPAEAEFIEVGKSSHHARTDSPLKPRIVLPVRSGVVEFAHGFPRLAARQARYHEFFRLPYGDDYIRTEFIQRLPQSFRMPPAPDQNALQHIQESLPVVLIVVHTQVNHLHARREGGSGPPGIIGRHQHYFIAGDGSQGGSLGARHGLNAARRVQIIQYIGYFHLRYSFLPFLARMRPVRTTPNGRAARVSNGRGDSRKKTGLRASREAET